MPLYEDRFSTGPLYDPSTSLLHFVDISENKVSNISSVLPHSHFPMPQVFHVNIDTHELAVEQFEEPVTCLALRQNGAGVSFEAFRIIFLTRPSS
jgi:sugar lactone lactonase YvrE